MRRAKNAATVTAAIAVSLTGCSAIMGPTAGRESERIAAGAAVGAAQSGVVDTGGLGLYLETMRTLIEADTQTKAATFREIAEAADVEPTTTNRLNYALALAVPGHLGSNDALAQRRLNALIASSDALEPAERMLATIQLHDVEQRLVLEVQATELRADLTAMIEAQDARSAERIQSLIEENRRLEAELDDAASRLDAIARIEQTIRELEDDAN